MTETLKMPGFYVEMCEEEMMYLDGGWSWSTLGSSLRNLYNRYSFASRALRAGGITLGVIANVARGAATYLYNTIAVTLGSVAAANWVVGVVIGISAGAAIWSMGTWVCFG